MAVLGPLGLLMLGLVAAGVAAHQAQWRAALVARPDRARRCAALGASARGAGSPRGRGAGRGCWRNRWPCSPSPPGRSGRNSTGSPASATSTRPPSPAPGPRPSADCSRRSQRRRWRSGLIDYAMQRQRFAATLRLTPEQSREDQKAMDGDPSLRGRRIRPGAGLAGGRPGIAGGGVARGRRGERADRRPRGRTSAGQGLGPLGGRRGDGGQAPPLGREGPDRDGRTARPGGKLARLAARPHAAIAPDLLADLAAIWPLP